jgi:hypothetical protein
MFKLLTPAPEVAVSKSTLHSEHLFQYIRGHFLNTGNIDNISPLEKQQLLHEAIRDGDYKLAAKFLDVSNVFSKDEYGDIAVVMALHDKNWEFLDAAKKYVTQKSADTDPVLGVISAETSAEMQSKMLGYAEEFFEIQ